ncbi:MAG: hypothetical protein LIO79_00760 [Rikenellaceae bacterium]|nr:hypothetical protein [Rikenellaceae bacterium]
MYFNIGFISGRKYACVSYQRGLSALLVLGGWACEGLKHEASKGKIPTLFLFKFFCIPSCYIVLKGIETVIMKKE